MTAAEAFQFFQSQLAAKGWSISDECLTEVRLFISTPFDHGAMSLTDDEIRFDLGTILDTMIEVGQGDAAKTLHEFTFFGMVTRFCPRPPWCR